MPINQRYIADLQEENIYHIYGRTNSKEELFREEGNYLFFLNKYDGILSSFWDTYAWCLLTNHFHWLIRVKTRKQLQTMLGLLPNDKLCKVEKKYLEEKISAEEILENACRRFLISYANSFNKLYNRHGSLFQRPFKRVLISSHEQLRNTLIYIHTNPVHHGMMNNFMKYKWSSWNSLVSDHPSKILRMEVLELFGGKDAMVKAHLVSLKCLNQG